MNRSARLLASASLLLSGAALLGALTPSLVGAQLQPTGQIVITTQTGVGVSALPNSSVTVNATGPSLTATPSSIGTLTYATDFSNDTRVITVIPGPYTVTATPTAGYTASYSTGCSSAVSAGQTATCTIIAGPSANNAARITVSVSIINSRGGTLIPGNIQLSVSGNNPAPAVFQGSYGGTTIHMGPGSYTVNVPSVNGYTSSLSGACSGTISAGDSRSCSVTYSDLNYNPYGYTGSLVCVPPNQNAALGQTVSFQAYGGTGTYTWKTADRTYINIGPVLTTSLQVAGAQTVQVTSGAQSAVCAVNVSGIYAYTGPSYQYPGGPGVVLGASTGPGFPNTGFEPVDWAGLLLALFAAVAAGVALYSYAPRLFRTRTQSF